MSVAITAHMAAVYLKVHSRRRTRARNCPAFILVVFLLRLLKFAPDLLVIRHHVQQFSRHQRILLCLQIGSV